MTCVVVDVELDVDGVVVEVELVEVVVSGTTGCGGATPSTQPSAARAASRQAALRRK